MPEVRNRLRERILGDSAQNPDGAADDEIAEALGLPHRAIAGGICRALERQGQIARVHAVGSGRVKNLAQPSGTGRARRMAPPPAWRPPIAVPALLIELDGPRGAHAFATRGSALLSIEEVSMAVASALDNDGWDVRPRPEGERGADLKSERAGERLVLVAIGESARSEAREGLLKSLGELLMLMDEAGANYAIALPATHQLIGLLQRLPAWARGQLSLRVFLVRLAESGLRGGGTRAPISSQAGVAGRRGARPRPTSRRVCR